MRCYPSVLLGVNVGLLEVFTGAGIPLLATKILVELTLIPVSFAAQKGWVFAQKHQREKHEGANHG